MKNHFQIQPLDYEQFARYFKMSGAELAAACAVRMTVTESPGSPCRVSLEDAQVGEEVILVTFRHLEVNSPYRASGPVFVRKDAKPANLSTNQLPTMLKSRMLSVRAYNSTGFMLDATVTPGADADSVIESFFEHPETEFIHIHLAKPGCFACSVVRA